MRAKIEPPAARAIDPSYHRRSVATDSNAAPRPRAEPQPRAPWTTRTGRVILLAALVVAPWPYGSVDDVWRYPLSAIVLLASALVGLGTDLTPGLITVLPLAAVPAVQILAGTGAPARTLDAGVALWTPLAAWLALRSPRGGRGAWIVGSIVGVSALLQAVFGLAQASVTPHSIYGLSTPWMTSSFGSFMNHNHFAGYAGLGVFVCLGLCVDRLRRDPEVSARALLWAGAAALVALADLAAGSRGGLLALAAGLVAFALVRTGRRSLRRAVLATAVAATVALVVALVVVPPAVRERVAAAATDGSAAYRLRLSAASLRLAATHPLLGAGLGSFEDAITAHKKADGDVRSMHAENDALEFVAETGLVGVAALAFAGFRLLATRGSSPLADGALAASVTLAVHSLCDFNLRVPATALCLAAVLAVVAPAPAMKPSSGAARAAIATLLGVLGLASVSASIAAVERSSALRLVDPLARAAGLSRALAWNPLSTAARRDRARALVEAAGEGAPGEPLRDARLARAAEAYQGLLALRPGWAEAWYELAWVELARGDRGAARRAVARASELDPGSVPLAAARAALVAQLEPTSPKPAPRDAPP
jgi:O-antigen ligase